MFTALAYNFDNMQGKLWNFVALAPVVNLEHTTDKFYEALGKTCKTIRDIDLILGNICVIGTGDKWKRQQHEFCNSLGYLSRDICHANDGLSNDF